MDGHIQTYFEISPVHQNKARKKASKEDEIPISHLTQFTHFPRLSFGDVQIGDVAQKKLILLNPKHQPQKVVCEKHSFEENGFIVSPIEASIAPGQSLEVTFSWSPKCEGKMRELVHWKTNLGVRSQTVLLGTCVIPKPLTKKKFDKTTGRTFSNTAMREVMKSPKHPLRSNNFDSNKNTFPPCKESSAPGLENRSPSSIKMKSTVDSKPKCKDPLIDVDDEKRIFDDESYIEECRTIFEAGNDPTSTFEENSRNTFLLVNSTNENLNYETCLSNPRNVIKGNLNLEINSLSPARRQTYVKVAETNYSAPFHPFLENEEKDKISDRFFSQNKNSFENRSLNEPKSVNVMPGNKNANAFEKCDSLDITEFNFKIPRKDISVIRRNKREKVEETSSRNTLSKYEIRHDNEIHCRNTFLRSDILGEDKNPTFRSTVRSSDNPQLTKESVESSGTFLELLDSEEYIVEKNFAEKSNVLCKETYSERMETTSHSKNEKFDLIPSKLNQDFVKYNVLSTSRNKYVGKNEIIVNDHKTNNAAPNLFNALDTNLSQTNANYEIISTFQIADREGNIKCECLDIEPPLHNKRWERIPTKPMESYQEATCSASQHLNAINIKKKLIFKKYPHEPQQILNLHKPQNIEVKTSQNLCSRWSNSKDKELSAITKWLNFILSPIEESYKEDVSNFWMKLKMSGCLKGEDLPEQNVISSRLKTTLRGLNKLRWKAHILYHNPGNSAVILKVKNAIEKKLLVIRTDRKTHVDIGMKQEIIKILLSYNPLWLRLGLETVYGEVICLASNNHIEGLTRFILTRLMNCSDISGDYAHPTVPFRYKEEYEEVIKRFQLEKFLLLVYFLDQAKNSRLFEHDPCLFNKGSLIKKSKDVLYAFAREFLCGVGDILKHLGYMGYVVRHEQTLLEEFDYSVTNIATDLRCGIRLAKVVDIVSENFVLSKQMRIPAVSRLQKIHNMKVVLDALKQLDVKFEPTYTPKDIVDGHLEKTYFLLWDIIFNLQIKCMLSANMVLEEIGYLCKSLSVKSSSNQKKSTLKILSEQNLEFFKSTFYRSENIFELLNIWVQLVCAHYNVEAHDTSVSYSDGLVFCLLLHHYHADILPLERIEFETTRRGFFEDCRVDSAWKCCVVDKEDFDKKLKKERANFDLFLRKIVEVGGVPILIHPTDMINKIPDENLTKFFVAYLCARLLNLGSDVKAARIIQLAWRKRRNTIKKKDEENKAVVVIQRWWRAVVLKKEKSKLIKSAVIIQRYWRKRNAHRLVEIFLRNEFIRKNESAKVIQKCVRRFLKKRRSIYEESCICIQKNVRMFLHRRRFLKANSSAIKIQSLFRGWKISQEFKQIKSSAVKIQHWWRDILERKHSHEALLFKHATHIQSAWRAYTVRKHFLLLRRSVILIQSSVRKIIAQKKYKKDHEVIVALQKRIKGQLLAKRERKQFLKIRTSAIIIQAAFKSWSKRKAYLNICKKTILIQTYFRMILYRRRFKDLRRATILIQRKFRSWVLLKRKKERETSAVIIQSSFRGYRCRKLFTCQVKACRIIQNCFRGFLCRRIYKRKLKAVAVIRVHVLSYLLSKKEISNFILKRNSAICIQKYWKCFIIRRNIERDKSATIIQSNFKGYLARKQLNNRIKKGEKIVEKNENVSSISRTKSSKENNDQATNSNISIKEHILHSHLEYSSAYDRLSLCKAVVKIQSMVRMWIKRKAFLRKIASARIIQACWRSYMIRNIPRDLDYKTDPAEKRKETFGNKVIIDSTFLISSNFQNRDSFQHYSALVIQKWWKNRLSSFELQKEFSAKREAAIIIQKWFRRLSQKTLVRTEYEAVCKLQAFWRMILAKRCYDTKIKKVLIIQRWWRMQLNAKLASGKKLHAQIDFLSDVKTNMHSKLEACLLIQAWWRSQKARRNFQAKKNAVITIQRHWRGTLKMIIAREYFIYLRRASVIFQSAWRAKVARKRFQTLTTTKQHDNKKRKSAILIQAIWRGFSVRRRLRYNRRITRIRGRLNTATVNASQSNTIGNKTEYAINNLAQHKDLKSILLAVMILDTSTRLSSVCCEKVLSGRTINILLFLLESCNRSIPHMQILGFVLNTFITLAKLPAFLPKFKMLSDLVPVVIRLMKIYYKKGSKIFTKCCTLLFILFSVSSSFLNMNDTQILKDISYLHNILNRKNVSKCLPSPSFHPSLKSEWLMKPSDKREFSDSLTAIVLLTNKMECCVEEMRDIA